MHKHYFFHFKYFLQPDENKTRLFGENSKSWVWQNNNTIVGIKIPYPKSIMGEEMECCWLYFNNLFLDN